MSKPHEIDPQLIAEINRVSDPIEPRIKELLYTYKGLGFFLIQSLEEGDVVSIDLAAGELPAGVTALKKRIITGEVVNSRTGLMEIIQDNDRHGGWTSLRINVGSPIPKTLKLNGVAVDFMNGAIVEGEPVTLDFAGQHFEGGFSHPIVLPATYSGLNVNGLTFFTSESGQA